MQEGGVTGTLGVGGGIEEPLLALAVGHLLPEFR